MTLRLRNGYLMSSGDSAGGQPPPWQGRPHITVLSTADWASDVWTNKQYLTQGLVDGGYGVTYIESLGLRRPRLSSHDLSRLMSRIRRTPAERPKPSENAAPAVVRPRVVPLHGLGVARSLSSISLRRQVKSLPYPRDVLWSFSPVTLGIERDFARTVYHSVDLLHEFPGVHRKSTLHAEAELLTAADAAIASTELIRDHMTALVGGTRPLLWRNVADIQPFLDADPVERGPRALFAGTLTPYKLDLDLLSALLAGGVDLHIAGPVGIDGSSSPELGNLLGHTGVTYHGNLSRKDLADLAVSCRVGIIPYRVSPYTQGVDPLKIYEYLAAGLAVVATPLPSLAGATGDVAVESGPDFVGAVLKELSYESDGRVIATRRELAEAHSWQVRIGEVEELLSRLSLP